MNKEDLKKEKRIPFDASYFLGKTGMKSPAQKAVGANTGYLSGDGLKIVLEESGRTVRLKDKEAGTFLSLNMEFTRASRQRK